MNNRDLADLQIAENGACRHFVENHTILRTFLVKYSVLFTEDKKRRIENGELRLDKRDLG